VRAKVFHFTSIVLAAALTLAVPFARAFAEPKEGWEAKPPHHIRQDATASPTGYTPSQIRSAYGFSTLSLDGTGQVIAIVIAYDAPTIASDLAFFSSYFKLPAMSTKCTVARGPHPCFQKVFASGTQPKADAGWSFEASLDVQWAHAIAPGADIMLVEAKSAAFTDLLQAVDVAVAQGAHVVSMSWGGTEFSNQGLYDSHFNHSGVAFVAASGDSGTGVQWPAVSPYVVGVGGTTLTLSTTTTSTTSSTTSITTETAWSGSGGGVSAYSPQPGYQVGYAISSGGKRSVPDVAYYGNPKPGLAVYDTTAYQGMKGWLAAGGTSAGTPQWAALIALANQLRSGRFISTSNLSSSPVYFAGSPPKSTTYAANYRDVTSGSDGTCATCTSTTGFDFVTGLGSPKAAALVQMLLGY
jgi:subtilase family serine protease